MSAHKRKTPKPESIQKIVSHGTEIVDLTKVPGAKQKEGSVIVLTISVGDDDGNYVEQSRPYTVVQKLRPDLFYEYFSQHQEFRSLLPRGIVNKISKEIDEFKQQKQQEQQNDNKKRKLDEAIPPQSSEEQTDKITINNNHEDAKPETEVNTPSSIPIVPQQLPQSTVLPPISSLISHPHQQQTLPVQEGSGEAHAVPMVVENTIPVVVAQQQQQQQQQPQNNVKITNFDEKVISDMLKQKNEELNKENNTLRETIHSLTEDKNTLNRRIDDLTGRIDGLLGQNGQLTLTVQQLTADKETMKQEINKTQDINKANMMFVQAFLNTFGAQSDMSPQNINQYVDIFQKSTHTLVNVVKNFSSMITSLESLQNSNIMESMASIPTTTTTRGSTSPSYTPIVSPTTASGSSSSAFSEHPIISKSSMPQLTSIADGSAITLQPQQKIMTTNDEKSYQVPSASRPVSPLIPLQQQQQNPSYPKSPNKQQMFQQHYQQKQYNQQQQHTIRYAPHANHAYHMGQQRFQQHSPSATHQRNQQQQHQHSHLTESNSPIQQHQVHTHTSDTSITTNNVSTKQQQQQQQQPFEHGVFNLDDDMYTEQDISSSQLDELFAGGPFANFS